MVCSEGRPRSFDRGFHRFHSFALSFHNYRGFRGFARGFSNPCSRANCILLLSSKYSQIQDNGESIGNFFDIRAYVILP